MSAQQLQVQKKAQIQRKINEKRIGDMYKIQDQLRKKFIEVNEFMKDCMEKTTRSEAQIEAELKTQEKLKSEIESIENDLNELSVFEEKFKETIKEFQPYEDVFQQVIDQSEEFESFEDLMGKCDALSKDFILGIWIFNNGFSDSAFSGRDRWAWTGVDQKYRIDSTENGENYSWCGPGCHRIE